MVRSVENLPLERSVDDAHPRPLFLILIRQRGLLLGVDEAARSRRWSATDRAGWSASAGSVENALLELVEVGAFQQVHDPGDVGIAVDDGRPDCSPEPPFFDFLGGQTEQEEILVAAFLADFDVGAIQGADGDGTIHHELHVAGARGFLAGGGNLLGQIGAGADDFHRRDPIVG
jgi:hypothetical protein